MLKGIVFNFARRLFYLFIFSNHRVPMEIEDFFSLSLPVHEKDSYGLCAEEYYIQLYYFGFFSLIRFFFKSMI